MDEPLPELLYVVASANAILVRACVLPPPATSKRRPEKSETQLVSDPASRLLLLLSLDGQFRVGQDVLRPRRILHPRPPRYRMYPEPRVPFFRGPETTLAEECLKWDILVDEILKSAKT